MSIIGHGLVWRLRSRAFARKRARGMEPADRGAGTGYATAFSGRATAMVGPNEASRAFWDRTGDVASTVPSRKPGRLPRLRAFLLPEANESDDDEGQEMTRILTESTRPRARDDLVLVRAGREGTYWQAADGLIVRLAAPEADHADESAQRELLTLACHDAVKQ